MQNRHLYTLLDTTHTTIKVVFGKVARTKLPVKQPAAAPWTGGDKESEPESWTYKVRKDMGIQVDDAVIVDSPSNGLQIVRVVAVHDTPQIDLDAPFEYKWVIQKIDRAEHDAQVAKEHEFNQMMLEVERTRQRELTLNDLRTHLPEGSEARRLFEAAQQLLPPVPAAPQAPNGGTTYNPS